MQAIPTQNSIQEDVETYILANKRQGKQTSMSGVFKHVRLIKRNSLIGDMIIASSVVREVGATREISDVMLLTLKRASKEARSMTGVEWSNWRNWIKKAVMKVKKTCS